jgi:L-threonine kinase
MQPNSPSITIAIPGTCGELVQGWSADWDEAVLVSCPITFYSRVRVELRPGPEIITFGLAQSYPKSKQAAHLLLDYLGRPDLGAEIHLNSQLQPGRGMASSTADIIGVMVGVAAALDHTLAPGELARLACQIEPSDSTMFAGLTMLAYRGSARYRELGPVPPLPLLMLDTGQAIDTLAYNARLNLAAVRQLASSTQTALELLSQGLANHDAEAIGAAATLSAFSYQAINYSPWLEQIQTWGQATGALGLVRAHSGSVFGLLYGVDTNLAEPARWLSTRFNGLIQPTYLTRGSYLLSDTHPSPHLMEVSTAL